MGFFDFLTLLVIVAVLLIVLFVVFDLYFSHQAKCQREGQERERRRYEQENHRRHMSILEPAIIGAMDVLEHARHELPMLMAVDIKKGYSSDAVTHRMDERFRLVVATCCLKFGDQATDMALATLGLERFIKDASRRLQLGGSL